MSPSNKQAVRQSVLAFLLAAGAGVAQADFHIITTGEQRTVHANGMVYVHHERPRRYAPMVFTHGGHHQPRRLPGSIPHDSIRRANAYAYEMAERNYGHVQYDRHGFRIEGSDRAIKQKRSTPRKAPKVHVAQAVEPKKPIEAPKTKKEDKKQSPVNPADLVTLEATVTHIRTGKYNLGKPGDYSYQALVAIAEDIEAQFEHVSEIKITGHSDSVGDSAYNMTLSKKRAQVVGNWLAKRLGGKTKIRTTGKGETELMVSCSTIDVRDKDALDDCRGSNRRVHIEVTGVLRKR